MISTTRYLRLIPLLALPASSLAQAQNDRSGQRSAASAEDPIVASLPNWDFNHDGIFTCENWKKYMSQLFNRADTGRNAALLPRRSLRR